MRTAVMMILLLLLGACETKEHADAELAGVKHAKEAAARAAQHASTGETEEFGVSECDDYVRKYEQCLADKVPPDAQASLRVRLENQKRTWRSAAADPEQKAALPAQCKDALASAKSNLSAYGCEW